MAVDCCTVPSAPLSAAAEILTLYHRCATLFALFVSAPSHASLTCNLWSRQSGVGESPPASSSTQQPQCSSSSIFRAAFVSANSCAPARSTAHAYGTVHQYQRYPAAHSLVVSKRRRHRTIESAATSAWLAAILPQFTTIKQVAIFYIALHEHIASHAFSDVHAQPAQRTNAHAVIRRGMETCIQSSAACLNGVAALDRGNRIVVVLVSASTIAQNRGKQLACNCIRCRSAASRSSIVSSCARSPHLALTPTTAVVKTARSCRFVALVATAVLSILHPGEYPCVHEEPHSYEVVGNKVVSNPAARRVYLLQLLPSHAQVNEIFQFLTVRAGCMHVPHHSTVCLSQVRVT
jgi:hypothetical protein